MVGKLNSMSRESKIALSAVAVVLIAAAAFAILAMSGNSAEVSGQTPPDRVEAVCGITDQRSSGAVEALVRTAEGDKDEAVRQAAVVGLGRFDAPEARQAVEKALADPSPKVRIAAAGTLGMFGDPAAADRLGALAASQASLAERKASLLGLARCESERSVMWLQETAEKDPDPAVKLAAIRELYKKLGMRYVGDGPANVTQWLDGVELTKDFPQVIRAYSQAGRVLDRHPENLRRHYEPVPDLAPASAPGGKHP